MHPVIDIALTREAFALGNLILMMGENVIDTARVDIEL